MIIRFDRRFAHCIWPPSRRLALAGAAPARSRSATTDRSLHRQSAARGKRHLSVVPGLGHQINDRLHDAARDQGRPHLAQYIADGIAQRGGAAADQDGLQASAPLLTLDNALKMLMVKSANDMAVDDCRRRRRLDRGFCRPDERQCAPARHDAEQFRQPERPAGGKPRHLGARSRHPGARADHANFRNTTATGTSHRSVTAIA